MLPAHICKTPHYAIPCIKLISTILSKKPFEKIVLKGENAGDQHLLPLALSQTSPGFYVSALQVS